MLTHTHSKMYHSHTNETSIHITHIHPVPRPSFMHFSISNNLNEYFLSLDQLSKPFFLKLLWSPCGSFDFLDEWIFNVLTFTSSICSPHGTERDVGRMRNKNMNRMSRSDHHKLPKSANPVITYFPNQRRSTQTDRYTIFYRPT